jgi:hypothetical protein
MDESWLHRGVSAEDVARFGLDALARNKREAPMGVVHRLQAFGTRLTPYWLLLRLSERYMRGRS